ncbi:helix-turn-helix domain-containing protein [candidate division CSSED10-310 bacterium]|uniref:Helix-turn-helix domain-containing protein n=1 Tax=candidate division CSSED10-310 bacterium TaxID=2855610 RepID=A0ABV6Z6U3_UNCC1
MAFADKLRRLRKHQKWSQDELGQKIGIHGRHVGKYEAGQVMPNAESLIRIAKISDVTIDYLLLDDAELRLDLAQNKELLRLFDEVNRMDADDQAVVKSLIDAYITLRNGRWKQYYPANNNPVVDMIGRPKVFILFEQ